MHPHLHVIQAAQTSGHSPVEVLSLAASLATLIALALSIWQTILSRRSLEAARKSIEDASLGRQLATLPEAGWVIEVQVALDHWHDELERRRDNIRRALLNKDASLLKEASKTHIKKPSDVGLHPFLLDKMPEWLKQLWFSGAQYYFNAAVCLPYVMKDASETPNWDYAISFVDERCTDSILAIEKLRSYIREMVPLVILQTPASVSSAEFVRD